MKAMKKEITIALCACLAITGCGGGGGTAAAPSLQINDAPLNDTPPSVTIVRNQSSLPTMAIAVAIPATAVAESAPKRSTPTPAETPPDQPEEPASGRKTSNLASTAATNPNLNINLAPRAGVGSSSQTSFRGGYTGEGSPSFTITTQAPSETSGGAVAAAQVDTNGDGVSDSKFHAKVETWQWVRSGGINSRGTWVLVSVSGGAVASGVAAGIRPANTNTETAGNAIGAFFSTQNEFQNINMARGRASYKDENASGLYLVRSGGADTQYGGEFNGAVVLDADFESNKISGKLTDISAKSVAGVTTQYGGAIQFGEADITSLDNGAGNFFSGDSSGTITHGTISYASTGNWGGLFHHGNGENGERPLGVGGTFSGTARDTNNVGFDFMGAYDAARAGTLAYSGFGFAGTVQFPTAFIGDSKPRLRDGVISQSTNADGNKVTRDLLKVLPSGDAQNQNYVVSYDATGDGNAEFAITAAALPTASFSPIDYNHLISVHGQHPEYTEETLLIGGVPVDKDGNGSHDGHFYLDLATSYHYALASSVVATANYFVSGSWFYAPANSNAAAYDFGVFFHTPEEHKFKNINGIFGKATYVHSVDGYYMPFVSGNRPMGRGIGSLSGTLALNADFDANKIGGALTGIKTVTDVTTSYGGAINFAETGIISQNNGAGNFFSGSSSGTLTADSSTLSYTSMGNWGGVFYGNGDRLSPAGAGGTFAGRATVSNGDGFHYYSTFNASLAAYEFDFSVFEIPDLKIPSMSIFRDSKPQHKNGFVSQSTNVNGTNVTEDLFNISVSGMANNPNYVISYDATGDGSAEFAITTSALKPIDFVFSVPSYAPFLPEHAFAIKKVAVDKDGDGATDGRLWLGASTEYYNDADIPVSISADTDYLHDGWWIYEPTNRDAADYDFGRFLGAPQKNHFKNIHSASGIHTGVLESVGFYFPFSNSSSSSEIGSFGFLLTLSANFGTNKVSGSLSKIYTETAAGVTTQYGGAINFAESDIESLMSGESNFFSGAASGTLTNGGSNYSASGNYGGMFFGGDGADGDTPKEGGVVFSGTAEDSNGNGFHYSGNGSIPISF